MHGDVWGLCGHLAAFCGVLVGFAAFEGIGWHYGRSLGCMEWSGIGAVEGV